MSSRTISAADFCSASAAANSLSRISSDTGTRNRDNLGIANDVVQAFREVGYDDEEIAAEYGGKALA